MTAKAAFLLGRERLFLHELAKRRDYGALKLTVQHIDPKAFIISYEPT
jgi:uncharacterized protein YebE (UPF0316 family)